MKPRIGATLVSTADDTTVVVIRWGPEDLELTCGGATMVDQSDRAAATPGALDATRAAGTHLGKRYHDEAHGVELLCTRAGWGSLAIGGTPMALKLSTGEANLTSDRSPAQRRTPRGTSSRHRVDAGNVGRPPPGDVDIFDRYGRLGQTGRRQMRHADPGVR